MGLVNVSVCRTSQFGKAVERMSKGEVFADDEFRAAEQKWVTEEAARWGVSRRDALLVLELHYLYVGMHGVEAQRPRGVLRKRGRKAGFVEFLKAVVGHAG
jgi:hypothetical protein